MANYAGFGAILEQFNTTSGYVAVGQVDDIAAPSLGLDTPDVTAHDSASAFRQVVGGIKEIGEVGISLVFDPAAVSHVGLWTALTTRQHSVFKMTFPNAGNTTWAFRAFVTNFEPGAPVGDKLSASLTLLGTQDPKLESDFQFLVDDLGNYLVDESGRVLVES